MAYELDRDVFPELDHPDMIAVGVGELAIAQHPKYLMTPALGSCVGVALYDPVLKQGGLAHVMLPEPLETSAQVMQSRFATVAIPDLVGLLVDAGSPSRRLVAKIAGGASMFAADSAVGTVGQRNIVQTKRQLELLNIRLVAEDTGKRHARTVELRLDTGVLVVRSYQYGVSSL